MSTFRVCAASLAVCMAAGAYAGVCDNEISGQIVSKVMHESMTGYVIKSDKLNDLIELRTSGEDSARLSKGFVTKSSIEGAKCTAEKNADGVEIYVLVKGSGKVKQTAAGALTEKEMIALYDQAVELDATKTPENAVKALNLMKKAADAGLAKAQYGVAGKYLYGRGVTADPQVAVRYFEMAAEQGHADSMNELAIMYGNGIGVPVNAGKAMELLRRCAELENEYCMSNLGLSLGDTPEERQEAAELFRKAAAKGNVVGIANYGAALCSGEGVDQPDGAECIRLLTDAMNRGYVWAYTRLADAYKDGDAGIPINPQKALEIIKSGVAATGDTEIINTYGYYLYEGIGCEPDYKNASRYFLLSAEKGSAVAMSNVGELYEKGEGYFQKDMKKAAEWYKKARAAGYNAAKIAESLKRIGAE